MKKQTLSRAKTPTRQGNYFAPLRLCAITVFLLSSFIVPHSAFPQATVMVDTNTGAVLYPTNFFDANGMVSTQFLSTTIVTLTDSGAISVLTAAVASNGAAISTNTSDIATNTAAIATLTGQVATAAVAIATLTGQVAAISVAAITNAIPLQGSSNHVAVSNQDLRITFSTNVATAGSGSGTSILTNIVQTTMPGSLYYLASNSLWVAAVNTNSAQCSRMLAIAIGTNSGPSAGMLRYGLLSVTPPSSIYPGDALFVDSTDGAYTATVPTNSATIIRAIGHATATNAIFFAPDAIWGTIQ